MHEDIGIFQRWTAKHKRTPRARVYPLSYLDHARRVKPHSIDVLITSPPYLNNYHYVRNTRPHLFWLGMVQASSDLKTIEHQSFGQFWQTVRAGPEVRLRPTLPHLAECLEELRARHAEKASTAGADGRTTPRSTLTIASVFVPSREHVCVPVGRLLLSLATISCKA